MSLNRNMCAFFPGLTSQSIPKAVRDGKALQGSPSKYMIPGVTLEYFDIAIENLSLPGVL